MKTFLSIGFSLLFIFLSLVVSAQNYTSIADGNWTNASTWQNNSGWGANTPATNGGSGTINLSHNIILSGNLDLGSRTLNINAGGVVTITGNTTLNGGSRINVNSGGTLYIESDVLLNSKLQINRGGKVVVDGTVTVNSSPNLEIAETGSANTEQYADMIIKQDLISTNSGDVVINYNGRLAVYGDVSGSGGGTYFTVNEGGQVYVDGDMTFTGGGSGIVNNNSTSPYGLYVNGNTVSSGGGSTVTSNVADKEQMINTNPDFAEWVAAEPGNPLESVQPIVLLEFLVSELSHEYIELSWTTSSEKNNSHFIILNSQNAREWKEVGKVEGTANSTTEIEYKFRDTSADAGINYYSLKQVDFDGSEESFHIIVANKPYNTQFNVYPNPTTEAISINLGTELLEENITLNLFDLKGKLVKSEQVHTSTILWNISDLKKSTYLLKVQGGSSSFPVQKIIKN